MIDYGMGAATRAAMDMFNMGCRQTGRTLRMCENANPGDRIVAHDERAKRYIERILRDIAKENVEVVAIPVSLHGDHLARLRPASGRLMFDHNWVEQFYMARIGNAQADIRRIAEAFSNAKADSWPDTYPQLVPFAGRY